VRCAEHLARGVPLTWITSALFFYARIARWRQHADPDVHASIGEFIARRTELDRAAAAHRLRLIAHHDPRDTARATTLPVFFLSGFFDPIVPWPFVRHWLAYHCPGFRASRILPFSHHAVLSVSPKKSADLIATWMRSAV
jgi:pimeloyl-ACP methyl ester carboxylesterase